MPPEEQLMPSFQESYAVFHVLSKPLLIVRMMSRPLASTFLTLLLVKQILVYLLPCFWTRWRTCEAHSYSGTCRGSQINRLMLRLLLLRRVSHLQVLHVDTYCIFRVCPVCSDKLPCMHACTADPCVQNMVRQKTRVSRREAKKITQTLSLGNLQNPILFNHTSHVKGEIWPRNTKWCKVVCGDVVAFSKSVNRKFLNLTSFHKTCAAIIASMLATSLASKRHRPKKRT